MPGIYTKYARAAERASNLRPPAPLKLHVVAFYDEIDNELSGLFAVRFLVAGQLAVSGAWKQADHLVEGLVAVQLVEGRPYDKYGRFNLGQDVPDRIIAYGDRVIFQLVWIGGVQGGFVFFYLLLFVLFVEPEVAQVPLDRKSVV